MDYHRLFDLLNSNIQIFKRSKHYACAFSKAQEHNPPSYIAAINPVKYQILCKLASQNLKDFNKWLISYKNLNKLSCKLENMVSVFHIIDQLVSHHMEDSTPSGLIALEFFVKENLFQDNSKKMDPNFEEHDHFTLEALYYALRQADQLKVLLGKAEKLGGELTEVYSPLVLDVLNSLHIKHERILKEVFELKLLMLIRMQQYDKALDLLLKDYEDNNNVLSAYRVFTLALGLTLCWKKRRDILGKESNKETKQKSKGNKEIVQDRFLAFANYTYSIWIRIAKKNSDVIYKQPKMFQGFIDLCFTEGSYKDIREHLYDNPVFNPLNYYKKKEEIFYKAKYNLCIGKTDQAFLILGNWLYELFEKKDLEGLIYYRKFALNLFEKAVLDINSRGSPNFRLKTISEHISHEYLPHDPEKPFSEVYNGRRVKSRPREKIVHLDGNQSMTVHSKIKSLDIIEDKTQPQPQNSKEISRPLHARNQSQERKPRSETMIDKKINQTDAKLTHEEFLNMVFCLLFRILLKLKEFTSEELKDPNLKLLIKGLYLLELNIKIFYEEFTKETSNDLITTIVNLVNEKSLKLSYEDIKPALKYLSRKSWRYLVEKVLPQTIKTRLFEFQMNKNFMKAEELADDEDRIIRLFMLYNSVRCNTTYHQACKLSKKEIYSILLIDVLELVRLKEVFVNISVQDLFDNFLDRFSRMFTEHLISPSKKKLENLAAPELFDEGEPDLDQTRKHNSELQVKDAINVYEIMYWYALEIYSKMDTFTSKKGIYCSTELFTKIGIQEDLDNLFFEKVIDSSTGANKKKRKNLARCIEYAGEFYYTTISSLFSIQSLFKFSKKILHTIYSKVESQLQNSKLAPLDHLSYEEMAELLYFEEQFPNSYAFILGEYFFTLGMILDDETKNVTEKWKAQQENVEQENASTYLKKTLCKLTVQEFFNEFDSKFKFFSDIQHKLMNSQYKLEQDKSLSNFRVFELVIWEFMLLYNQTILINIEIVHTIVWTKKTFYTNNASLVNNQRRTQTREMIDELEKEIETLYPEPHINASDIDPLLHIDKRQFYDKGWKWILEYIKVVQESLETIYMKDVELLVSAQSPEAFKHIVGFCWVIRKINLLGITFSGLVEDIIRKKMQKTNQSASCDLEILSSDIHSFQINMNYDFPKISKVKTGSEDKYEKDYGDLYKNWSVTIDYQIYQDDSFIKTHSLDKLKERIFLEKSSETLGWSQKIQEKVNFLVNVITDLLGMFSRAILELVPNRYETFEERFLLSINTTQKETHKDLIRLFLATQKESYAELRKALANFFGVLAEKLRNLRQYLENEMNSWKENVHIANVFNKAKKKLKTALKTDLSEELIESMARQYMETNIKIMEKLMGDINTRNSTLSGFKSILSAN